MPGREVPEVAQPRMWYISPALPADGFPDIVRFLHGVVRQKQSAADVHLAAARQFFKGKQHRVFANVLTIGVRIYGAGGIAAFYQPRAVPRVHGTTGALAVSLLGHHRFCQTAVGIEHVGGYRVRRIAAAFFIPCGIVVQAHRRAHGFQQLVQLAGGVQIQIAHIRLAAENDRAAVFDKRPDFLHKFFVKGL